MLGTIHSLLHITFLIIFYWQVFGEVAEGLETLTRINEAYVDQDSRPFKNIRYSCSSLISFISFSGVIQTISFSRTQLLFLANAPKNLNRIKHTYVLDDPFDDPPQIAELIPDASPEGKPKDEVMCLKS